MRFSLSSFDLNEALAVLDEQGAIIVENVLSQDRLNTLQQQAQHVLHGVIAGDPNEFMGSKTKRTGALLTSMPATRTLVLEPTVLNILDQCLTRYSPVYQLHFTGLMHVMHGEKPQIPHRDSTPFLNPSPVVVLATMWALSDFKKENGATAFVPGSHKWHDSRKPLAEEFRYAEMPAGSVLIWAGNLIHGAGGCTSGYRTGLSLQYSCSWLRQEENQYLAVSRELAKTFSEPLQKLIGYDLASRHWGYVGQQHPLKFLQESSDLGSLDPEGYDMELCTGLRGLRVVAEEPFKGQLYPEENC